LELAFYCFGSIGRCLKACQQDALDLGFHGLAALPGEEFTASQIAQLDGRHGVPLSAAWWGSLLDPDCRELQFAVSATDQNPIIQVNGVVKTILGRWKRSGAKVLIVDAGYLQAQGARERGQSLLAGLREAGRVEAGLEALEPLAQALKEDGEQQLEQFARFMHDIKTMAPGVPVAVVVGDSPASLLTPRYLKMLREDAGLDTLGYWHDCGRCEIRSAFGLDQAGDWLDLAGSFMRGCTLQDWAEGRDFLLPGEGQVDFSLLADYLPRTALQVLSVAPLYPMDALPQAREVLATAGIR
jgi:hypothetical protein